MCSTASSAICTRAGCSHAPVTMRQEHRAGEKMFVDFSGDGIDLVDPKTGEVTRAKLFVAVLGASSLTYVEPVLDESLPTWIGCHVRAFEFFGGVPEIVVPDNLKSGVKRPDRYEPELNPTYADLAQHYGCAVIPARVRRPRDKAKVESAVLIAERWILAVLRNRTFALAQRAARGGDPAGGQDQHTTDAQAEEVATRALRGARQARAAAAAGASLRIRAVEEGARQHRLPRRVRRALLQRAVSARARTRSTSARQRRAWRSSIDGKRVASHVRSFGEAQADDRPAAHARVASCAPGVDAVPDHEAGRRRSVPCTAKVAEQILRARIRIRSRATARASGSSGWQGLLE